MVEEKKERKKVQPNNEISIENKKNLFFFHFSLILLSFNSQQLKKGIREFFLIIKKNILWIKEADTDTKHSLKEHMKTDQNIDNKNGWP